jgi:hypothetical protein
MYLIPGTGTRQANFFISERTTPCMKNQWKSHSASVMTSLSRNQQPHGFAFANFTLLSGDLFALMWTRHNNFKRMGFSCKTCYVLVCAPCMGTAHFMHEKVAYSHTQEQGKSADKQAMPEMVQLSTYLCSKLGFMRLFRKSWRQLTELRKKAC